MTDQQPETSRRVTIVSVVVSGWGLLLFAYTLERAGVGDIVRGIAGIGVGGFLLILLLSGVRMVLRALAWMRCVERPERLSFADAYPATVMGESLGNLTPLATFLSEPSKAAFVRDKISLGAGLSAIIVENIYYTASVAMVIALGAIAFLTRFEAGRALRLASIGTIGVMVVIVALAFIVMSAGMTPISRVMEWIERKGWQPSGLAGQRERVLEFERQITTFYARNRSQFLPLLALEAGFHLAGICEAYVTLRLVSEVAGVTLLSAFILEATGRVINVIFTFVPMRIGVDEAGTGLLAQALHLGTAPGVMLAILRKARIMVWTGVGVLFLLYRGFTVRRALEEAEAVAEQD